MPYNSPQVEFLLSVYSETPNYFAGAYNFLTTKNYGINTKELFFGAILAYEYNLKGKTEVTNRRKPEQKSIAKLKIDFQEYLSKSETQLIDHLNEANKTYEQYATQIDIIKTEKENLFTDWFENTKTEEWQKWFEEKTLKIEKLEETYETKLKLEKPAKYWESKSTKYYKQGQSAKTILICVIVITAVF